MRLLVSTLAGAVSAGLLITAPLAAHAAEPDPTATSPTAQQPVQITAPERFRGRYLATGTLRLAVSPAAYAGAIEVTDWKGQPLAQTTADAGQAVLKVPAQRLGDVRLRINVTETAEFTAATARTVMNSKGTRLSPGDRSPVVKPLLRKLKQLNFLIPGVGSRFTRASSDVVMAFQKTHELRRTGRMNAETWQTLAKARPVKSRYSGNGTHLEIDKTRQIMMLVRNGEVKATLHVSTGKTGNTPEGRFRIFAKGIGYLYKFMPFLGNYGIHGYVPVPKQPASAGCIREPMWAADYFYNRSRVGTVVHVYR